MQNKIIKFILKYPKALIGTMLLITIFLSFGVLELEQEFSQKTWFRKNDPLLLRYEDFTKRYGSDTSVMIVISFKRDLFNLEDIKTIYDVTEKLYEVPNIIRVDSLTNYTWKRANEDDIYIGPLIPDPDREKWNKALIENRGEVAKGIKPLENYLLSADRKTAVIIGTLKNIDKDEGRAILETTERIEKEIISKFSNSRVSFHLAGSSVVGLAFKKASRDDLFIILPIAISILLIILFLTLYRSKQAIFYSLAVIFLTILSTIGLQGWLGVKYSLITSMCPLIVLAICIADSIHLLSTYFYEKSESPNSSSYDLLFLTLEKNIQPTFLTTISTVLGFASLIGADLAPISDLGIVAGSGVMLAWLYTFFLMAPLLNIYPLRKKPQGSFAKKIWRPKFLINLTINHTGKIISIVTVTSLLSIFLSFQNTIDSNILNYFSEKTQIRKTISYLQKNIGGASGVEVILDSKVNDGIKNPQWLKSVDSLLREIEKLNKVTKVNSIIAPIKEMNQVLTDGKKENYVIPSNQKTLAEELFFLEMNLPPEKSMNHYRSIDYRYLRINIAWARMSSQNMIYGIEEINHLIKKHNLSGYVTGKVTLISGLDSYIVKTFFSSMLMAIALISIMMMFVFKSVTLGLFSMIPNIISPFIGASVLYLLGRPFDVGSVLIFSICLGIAVDDTIYFLTHYRRLTSKGLSSKEALTKVFESSALVLFSTTLVLVSVFFMFILGSFVPNTNFAIATSIILSMALVLDLTLLPSLIYFLDKDKSFDSNENIIE